MISPILFGAEVWVPFLLLKLSLLEFVSTLFFKQLENGKGNTPNKYMFLKIIIYWFRSKTRRPLGFGNGKITSKVNFDYKCCHWKLCNFGAWSSFDTTSVFECQIHQCILYLSGIAIHFDGPFSFLHSTELFYDYWNIEENWVDFGDLDDFHYFTCWIGFFGHSCLLLRQLDDDSNIYFACYFYNNFSFDRWGILFGNQIRICNNWCNFAWNIHIQKLRNWFNEIKL